MRDYNILKKYCNIIFLIGSGNYWYEENMLRDDQTLFYRLYSFVLLFIYSIMTLLEIMAAAIGDFPKDEMQDCVSFATSHTIVMMKILSIILNKNRLKRLNYNMVQVCEKYEQPSLMAKKYRIMKVNIAAYFVTVYGSAICFVFEGMRKLYEGSHFVTVVTYYPPYDDNSLLATVCRILATIVLFMMMLTMILSVDTFTMSYLIMYKYKLITLRHYFEGLKEQFDRQSQSGDVSFAMKTLTRRLTEGLVMHKRVLKLSQDIDSAFGLVLALQLCLSVCTTVPLLLQIALSDQLTFVARLKIIFFVVALFFLLGLFLCNAGEITYQATLLSDAIFNCGWHLCPNQPRAHDPRRLVLLATMQAQRPLVMKAFKMLELTYGTFLQVVRGTYSVFALFYAQNK